MSSPAERPLAGIRVCSLAGYIPGPLAAARLQALGAAVVKVEPPGGDPLAAAAPAWYAEITAGQDVLRLDLKQPAGQAALAPHLAGSDLLITASRPGALARLGLTWADLHARNPRLCQVSIVGFAAPAAEQAGHDLTYQAAAGLLDPPHLPRALIADLAGAEQAVSAALALLLARARGQEAGCAEVALAAAAAAFAAPLRHGLTAPDGLLGGALPGYHLYRAADGWVAVAALEPHFAARLAAALEIPALTRPTLEQALAGRPAAAWAAWAASRDLPLVAVPSPVAGAC